MNIAFTLNNKKINHKAPPLLRLSTLLRNQCGISSVRESTASDRSGYSMVILNNKAVPSSLIPVFAIRDAEIWTVEGLQTKPVFEIVRQAWDIAGAFPCDYCAPARIVVLISLLLRESPLSGNEIERQLDTVRCRCCDISAFRETLHLARKLQKRSPHESR